MVIFSSFVHHVILRPQSLPSTNNGHSLCKMVSFGEKFKFSKSYEKRLKNYIRVVLCKKAGSKKHLIDKKMTIFFQIAKIVHYAKAIAFAKWSVLVKNSHFQKHVKNVSRTTLKLFCAKNGSKKHLIDKK